MEPFVLLHFLVRSIKSMQFWIVAVSQYNAMEESVTKRNMEYRILEVNIKTSAWEILKKKLVLHSNLSLIFQSKNDETFTKP